MFRRRLKSGVSQVQRRAFLITGMAAGLATAAEAADVANEGFTGFSGAGAIPLERQTAVLKNKSRDPVGAVMVNFYQLWGSASRVRFTVATVPSFVVNGPADADPQARYGLFRLTVAKGARHLQTGRTFPNGRTNLNIQSRSKVPFTASRYGADFFKLDLAEPLTAGEYAWTITPTLATKFDGVTDGFGGKTGDPQHGVFAFGVD
ncbi:MAG: hypothetical protein JWR84_697 [Caulobacter sp.]|nr:hypothetical protein [Caulobacter sp.]